MLLPIWYSSLCYVMLVSVQDCKADRNGSTQPRTSTSLSNLELHSPRYIMTWSSDIELVNVQIPRVYHNESRQIGNLNSHHHVHQHNHHPTILVCFNPTNPLFQPLSLSLSLTYPQPLIHTRSPPRPTLHRSSPRRIHKIFHLRRPAFARPHRGFTRHRTSLQNTRT